MDWIWDSAWNYLSAKFIISGWWELLFYGVIICFAVTAIAWFFSALRPFAGAVVMSVVSALWAYWRAEKDMAKLQEEREARATRQRDSWWR